MNTQYVIRADHGGNYPLGNRPVKTDALSGEESIATDTTDKVDAQSSEGNEVASPLLAFKGVARGTSVMSEAFIDGGKTCAEVVGGGIVRGTSIMSEAFVDGGKTCAEVVGGGMISGTAIMSEAYIDGAKTCAEVIGGGMVRGTAIISEAAVGAPVSMASETFHGLKDGAQTMIKAPSWKKLAIIAGIGSIGFAFAAVTGIGVIGYAVFGTTFLGLGGSLAANWEQYQ